MSKLIPVNFRSAVLKAASAPLQLVYSDDYPNGAVMTKVALAAYKRQCGPTEFMSVSALDSEAAFEIIDKLEVPFVGSLDLKPRPPLY
jgi:hypothetical protein